MFSVSTKLSENICNNFKVIARTSFYTKIINRQNNVGRVKVPVLCILSDDALYLYKISQFFFTF